MKITLPWWVVLIAALVLAASVAIAVGNRQALKEAREGALPTQTALDSATAQRIRSQASLDSMKTVHAEEAAEAIVIVAEADTARRQSDRSRSRAARRARELAAGNEELLAQIDTLDASYDRLAIGYDSLRSEHRKLNQRYTDSGLWYEKNLADAHAETARMGDNRDYWRTTAEDALTSGDFDLFAWIPEGLPRDIAKGVGCVAVGTGVGLLANASDSRPPEAGANTAAVIGGVGAAGACVLATVAF